MSDLSNIFKAYDVRGIYPAEINEDIAEKIGAAFALTKSPKKVAVGQDVRSSGKAIKNSLIKGLLDSGVDVVDIGVITTDQLYFAVGHYGFDGGISVTASHNPAEYNGFKFAITGGAPPSTEDLENVKKYAENSQAKPSSNPGTLSELNLLNDYVEHVLSYIDQDAIKPFKVVANGNFGAVNRAIDLIAKRLDLNLETLNWTEDGNFPKGAPNPLLPENRDETIELIKTAKPDIGVAWDADADRCFFFTGDGKFIPSCYIIALLSEYFIAKEPGGKIIHDLTTCWVIDDAIKNCGGIAISNRTGHTFIKRRMREENSIFAGESSGHYYFRDSFFADNGIVPFLVIIQMMSKTGKTLDELVSPLMNSYFVSGEINFKVNDPKKIIAEIENEIGKEGKIDKTDGLVIESAKWRFSVRPSNTEPLFRLNAEAKDQKDLEQTVKRVSSFVN